jgi:hypothetical protein
VNVIFINWVFSAAAVVHQRPNNSSSNMSSSYQACHPYPKTEPPPTRIMINNMCSNRMTFP